MALFLIETRTADAGRAEVDRLVAALDEAARRADGGFVEAQVTADHKQLFAVVEAASLEAVLGAIDGGALAVDDIAEVRLVGATLDEVRAAGAGGPRYLVEWDLPEGLDMESYLARKKEKSPLYAEVPEVTFRRTYVREDMEKCLCFYDGGCEEDVRRARDVVGAPVDRFHELS